MSSQTGQQIIAVHILPNSSRSIGNETIKFGQLIKYNMINFLLKNHTQILVEKLVSDHFIKNKN